MIKSPAGRILRKANRSRGVGLRITIDEKCGVIRGGKASSEVYSGGGLADPTFLVGHRNNSRHRTPDGRKRSKAFFKMQDVSRGTQVLCCGISRCWLREPRTLFHVEH